MTERKRFTHCTLSFPMKGFLYLSSICFYIANQDAPSPILCPSHCSFKLRCLQYRGTRYQNVGKISAIIFIQTSRPAIPQTFLLALPAQRGSSPPRLPSFSACQQRISVQLRHTNSKVIFSTYLSNSTNNLSASLSFSSCVIGGPPSSGSISFLCPVIGLISTPPSTVSSSVLNASMAFCGTGIP